MFTHIDRTPMHRAVVRIARRAPRLRAGFSLLEVVIVLLLTGIIAGLAYPRIDVTRYKADAVVTGVRSAIQQAQRAALVAQHDVIISFDVTGQRIRIGWDADNDHNISSTEHIEWRSLSSGNQFARPAAGVRGAVTASIVGATLRTLDAMPTVTFHRDGSLSSDLEIYMSTIGAPTLWRAVTVVQATGRSDWYRMSATTGKWGAGAL
jgi:prepilin-type N-terminal cleavage/methylation domain-containing protein